MIGHANTQAQNITKHNIPLLRHMLTVLTADYRSKPYVPGRSRKPYMCVWCGGIYSARAIRAHSTRCEDNPQGFWNRSPILARGCITLTPRVLANMIAMADEYATGPCGAD